MIDYCKFSSLFSNAAFGIAYSPLLKKLSADFTPADKIALLQKLKNYKKDPDKIQQNVLQLLVSKHALNITAAHIMSHVLYEDDPVGYYDIYKNMGIAAKNSDEGKDIGERLRRLVKLMPGHQAPPIIGTTPDGKKFDLAHYKKKIYLLEFWKAVNDLSRMNHSEEGMQKMKSGITRNTEYGVIGISFDEKKDWWTSAIKDDKINWPQFSDLKGNESPNVTNWAIKRIPTYYLVDANWRIIERDITFQEATVVINQYLDHHP